MNEWLKREVGRLWLLSDLHKGKCNKLLVFQHHHIYQLRERGLITPSLREHSGWEITDKGRTALKNALK